MGKKNILARYALFIFGLYIMAIGIVLIVKCALCTTPIASLNYVLSVNTSLSLSVWTFIFNVVLKSTIIHRKNTSSGPGIISKFAARIQ